MYMWRCDTDMVIEKCDCYIYIYIYIYIMNDVNYNDDWKYWLIYMLNDMEIDMTLWKCWLKHEWWDCYDYGNEYKTCWKVWLAYTLNKVDIEVISDTWMMSSGQYESTGYMRMIYEQKAKKY